MTTNAPQLSSLNFKAGDTFHFVGELAYAALDAGTDWSCRASVRDLSKKERPLELVDTLTATITAPAACGDPWVIALYKEASGTSLWPRPNDPSKPHKLVCDVEIYETYDDEVVISTSTFVIAIQYDPTRAGDA